MEQIGQYNIPALGLTIVTLYLRVFQMAGSEMSRYIHHVNGKDTVTEGYLLFIRL